MEGRVKFAGTPALHCKPEANELKVFFDPNFGTSLLVLDNFAARR